MERKLIWHECRAAGIVFKTQEEWFKYLDSHKDILEPVAEHHGFKFNINDVCTNPNVPAQWKSENGGNYFEVRTARTQFGWICGYTYSLCSGGGGDPVSYPRRDEFGGFYETEKQAVYEAVCYLLRQLDSKRGRKTKEKTMFLYYLQKAKDKFDIRQLELFQTE